MQCNGYKKSKEKHISFDFTVKTFELLWNVLYKYTDILERCWFSYWQAKLTYSKTKIQEPHYILKSPSCKTFDNLICLLLKGVWGCTFLQFTWNGGEMKRCAALSGWTWTACTFSIKNWRLKIKMKTNEKWENWGLISN